MLLLKTTSECDPTIGKIVQPAGASYGYETFHRIVTSTILRRLARHCPSGGAYKVIHRQRLGKRGQQAQPMLCRKAAFFLGQIAQPLKLFVEILYPLSKLRYKLFLTGIEDIVLIDLGEAPPASAFPLLYREQTFPIWE